MFEVAQYAPLLHTRQSEMRGFRELPESTKDLLFPTFVLRPWPRARTIQLALDHILAATNGRPFGLDFEHEFPAADANNPAQVEFDEIRSPQGSFARYFQLAQSTDGAVPILQLNGPAPDIPTQVGRVNEIGRGGFARLTLTTAQYAGEIAGALGGVEPNDFAILIDVGWSPADILTQANWAVSLAQVFFDASPERPIVICGSSFPSMFSNIDRRANFPISERLLFNEVRSHLNANLIYGDWASGRPPTYDDSIKRTVARIDLALADYWSVFRAERLDDEDDQIVRESYSQIAERVIASVEWDAVPQIWARYMVECTAEDIGPRIRSQVVSAAVRMNQHLHTQAHFGTPELIGQTDDPYTD